MTHFESKSIVYFGGMLMSKNSNNNSMFGGCLRFFLILSLFSSTLGSMLYLDMKPKDKIKEEIIKKGDEFSIDNKDLSDYINVLEDLDISYNTYKDDDKTTIKIDRSNK